MRALEHREWVQTAEAICRLQGKQSASWQALSPHLLSACWWRAVSRGSCG